MELLYAAIYSPIDSEIRIMNINDFLYVSQGFSANDNDIPTHEHGIPSKLP